MKKILLLAVFALTTLSFAWENEYGVIQKMFQVELNGNINFYNSQYYDGDKSDLEDEETQTNVIPTIRVRPVRGIEFNFTYPFRDDGMKDGTGFWGPIVGFKYGGSSSAGFLQFVFPAGAKKLLGNNGGNGEKPSPALIFGGTNFFGNWESFGIRLHSWYFMDFNDNSADELFILLRPEINFGMIRIGVGFPFEFLFANSSVWISNTPGTIRAAGLSLEDDDFGYVMAFSIQPKVIINLGKIDLEPFFSIPLWKYTNSSAMMAYGFTLGMDAKINF